MLVIIDSKIVMFCIFCAAGIIFMLAKALHAIVIAKVFCQKANCIAIFHLRILHVILYASIYILTSSKSSPRMTLSAEKWALEQIQNIPINYLLLLFLNQIFVHHGQDVDVVNYCGHERTTFETNVKPNSWIDHFLSNECKHEVLLKPSAICIKDGYRNVTHLNQL